jgi:hypothetical protein
MNIATNSGRGIIITLLLIDLSASLKSILIIVPYDNILPSNEWWYAKVLSYFKSIGDSLRTYCNNAQNKEIKNHKKIS